MSDLLSYLAVMNLFAGMAVGVVMALRLPVRRLFGARVAYGLWALAPLAPLALLLPSRVIVLTTPAPAADSVVMAPPALVAQAPPSLDLWTIAAAVWMAGGAVTLAVLAWRQHQFARAVRDGRAGPAVVGVLRPRIVTPDDFTGLYTDREQVVVLAHEATHIARNDARVNALVALARCVNWFNPLVHLLAHYLRIDQELACDAQVVAAYPQARRSYAQAMLKAQLAARPLPLGCYWRSEGAHPLAERIRLLTRRDPGRGRRLVGTAMVALLGAGAMGAAWTAKPVRIVSVSAAPAPAARAAPAASPSPAPGVAPAPKLRAAQAKVATAPEPAPPPAPPSTDATADATAQAASDTAVLPASDDAEARSATAWGRRVSTRARSGMRPLIAPGTAVRVQATTTAPDGPTLANDITSYGSNPLYRSGSYRRYGSAYGLYTSVYQQAGRFWVTATVMHQRQPVVSGTVALASGETGDINLANGQVVTVTATGRPETPEETEIGRTAMRPVVFSGDAAMAVYRARTRAPREE